MVLLRHAHINDFLYLHQKWWEFKTLAEDRLLLFEQKLRQAWRRSHFLKVLSEEVFFIEVLHIQVLLGRVVA